MKRYLPIFAAAAFLMATGSCNKTEQVGNGTLNLNTGGNTYSTASLNERNRSRGPGNGMGKPMGANPTSDAGSGPVLGSVLFFETQFSTSNKLSCGSCHQPGKPISNSTAQSKMENRDGRPTVVKCTGTNELESMEAMVTRLNSLPQYKPMFQTAFGSAEITAERINIALAQYIDAQTAAINK